MKKISIYLGLNKEEDMPPKRSIVNTYDVYTSIIDDYDNPVNKLTKEQRKILMDYLRDLKSITINGKEVPLKLLNIQIKDNKDPGVPKFFSDLLGLSIHFSLTTPSNVDANILLKELEKNMLLDLNSIFYESSEEYIRPANFTIKRSKSPSKVGESPKKQSPKKSPPKSKNKSPENEFESVEKEKEAIVKQLGLNTRKFSREIVSIRWFDDDELRIIFRPEKKKSPSPRRSPPKKKAGKKKASPKTSPTKKKKTSAKKSTKKEPSELYYDLISEAIGKRGPDAAWWKETTNYLVRDIGDTLDFELRKSSDTKYILKVVRGRRKIATINKILLEEIKAIDGYTRKNSLPLRIVGHGIDSAED